MYQFIKVYFSDLVIVLLPKYDNAKISSSVCVNVTYVTVTDAIGFNIKAMSYKTLDIYEVNVPYDDDNTTYCLSLPVDEYNITIHDMGERLYSIYRV